MKKSILITILSVFAFIGSFGQAPTLTVRTYPIVKDTICVGDSVVLQFRIISTYTTPYVVSGCCKIEFDVLSSPTLIGTKSLVTMTIAPNDSTSLLTIKGVTLVSNGQYNIRVKYYGSICSGPQGATKPLTPYKMTYSTPIMSLITSNTVLCIGQTSTLTASGANTYTWTSFTPAQSIVVSPSVNTNYTVTGTNSIGCIASAVITQSVSTCTGINNSNSVKIINRVYPVPASDILNVELENVNENSKLILNIYSVEGRNVFSDKFDNTNKFTVDISNLATGMYVLEIVSDGLKSTKNIIVAR